jgi:hypothetical protein
MTQARAPFLRRALHLLHFMQRSINVARREERKPREADEDILTCAIETKMYHTRRVVGRNIYGIAQTSSTQRHASSACSASPFAMYSMRPSTVVPWSRGVAA